MKPNLQFHHIGIATRNFEKAIKTYQYLGYSIELHPLEVPTQKVRVCFLKKDGHPCIELIEPINVNSPVNTLLRKHGSGPYHLCYTTPNLKETIKLLKEEKFLFFALPVESTAFNNKMIVFAYKEELGFIEIVEASNYF